MSDLRPKHPEIEIGGKKYSVLFDLNAIDEIQDKFNIPISQLTDLLHDQRQVFKVLKFLLAILINEAIDDSESGEPHVDEKFIGRKIKLSDIPTLKSKVFLAISAGVPEGDEDPTPSE